MYCTMLCIPYVVLCIFYTLLFKTQQNVFQEKSYGGSCKTFFFRDPRDNFGPYCNLAGSFISSHVVQFGSKGIVGRIGVQSTVSGKQSSFIGTGYTSSISKVECNTRISLDYVFSKLIVRPIILFCRIVQLKPVGCGV